MTVHNVFRVARSAPSDTTFNTLELRRSPTFALMEFLDPGDSQYFASTLKGKSWRDITPEPHKSRKTLENVPAAAGELEAFVDVAPDWLYLSGHYGRTYYAADKKTLTVLPGGFFNEPFHKAEWESSWTNTAPKGVYLQGESLDDSGADVFHKYIGTQQLVHQKGPFKSTDPRSAAEHVAEWKNVWHKPTEAQQVSANPIAGSRGLLFTHVWDEVKVVLLVCCNALVWGKQGFHKAFPNAIILGWLGKNPANSKPIVRQFLVNAFRDVKDPADPILMDHDHIGTSWCDVFYNSRLFASEGMGYMLPGGDVFAVAKSPKKAGFIGTANQITHPSWTPKDHVFGFNVNDDATLTEP